MLTAAFWRATLERVIRAFAVAFLAALGTSESLDLRAVDWKAALAIAGAAALINLLVSLAAGAGIGPRGSPSLVRDPAAAGPVGDPVDALADRDRRVQRADLDERLHMRGEHRRDPDLPLR